MTILGRADNLVKVNGHLVDCARIAQIAMAQAGVSDAAATALARPDQPGMADVYVVAAGTGLDAARLQRALLDALPALRASLRLRLCESLPRDALGKLAREKLHAMLMPGGDGDADRR